MILLRRAPAPHDSGFLGSLLPADDEANAAIGKMALGDTVAVKIHRDRSTAMHRLFFAVLSHVGESTAWETAERLLVAIKVRLGFYDLCKLPTGKMVPVPQSISFDKMGQDEFADFFQKALDVICAEVLDHTITPDDLITEVCTGKGLSRPQMGRP